MLNTVILYPSPVENLWGIRRLLSIIGKKQQTKEACKRSSQRCNDKMDWVENQRETQNVGVKTVNGVSSTRCSTQP